MCAQLEARFKVLWANHGDEISRQYAGTGALKSGFTRTGKRTFGGKLDDGYKSLTRYYLNNFQDGRKQDALDLVTGTYRIEKGAPCTGLPASGQDGWLLQSAQHTGQACLPSSCTQTAMQRGMTGELCAPPHG